jgi:translation elongation factor EF-Ts
MENIVIPWIISSYKRNYRLYLKNQQYPEEIVEHGIQKALEKGPIHTELREQVHVTSNQNNVISFVTTYNPRDNNIFHFIVIHLLSVHFFTDGDDS